MKIAIRHTSSVDCAYVIKDEGRLYVTGRVRLFFMAASIAAAMISAHMPTPALAQEVQLVTVDVTAVSLGYRASKLIGTAVLNDKKEKIGKIDDFVIDKERVLFAVLQVGGFLGLGGYLVAVPYESLAVEDNGKKITLAGGSKEQLQKLPEFKYHE